ncbi:hydrolase, alpha/beta domain protein [Aeromicrobium marinum DSM 15272]|uniref:Hydrolase, alpha/beta domain protein n=1 Tax=Aeromicrobium marinum DSM 15272 TaxID=585531 RepID=E2SG40_9ACTN|nr:alpha/beta hydrolase [Aeromicrobium marinum]EFQ81797.1 hydrolase, alpha/beta domain protein [Aeromicrobium marinum DSM 15272]
MKRLTTAAVTAGAFAAAGATATVLNQRRAHHRRLRRGEAVEFGSVRGDRHTVVASDGIAINLEIDEVDPGTQDPVTLVLVHGWMCDLDTWHYQRLALRGRVRIIAVDQRGHGRSGRTSGRSSTFPLLADDLARVIEAHAPTGPVVLVGHSMGGMAVMQLAADRPDLFGGPVAGVMLIGTSAGRLVRGNAALQRVGALIGVSSPLLDWGRGFNSYSVIRRWAVGPDAAERHADMSNEMILRAPTRVITDFYPNFPSLDLFHALPTLATVRTVVLCGTADLLTPPKHSRRLADEIDSATLTLVDGAGHMVMFEEHERVTEALEHLVAEVA